MDRIIDWVKTCDTKASIMLTVVCLFTSFVFTSDFVLNGLHSIVKSFTDYDFKRLSFSDINLVGLLTILALGFSLYFLFGSIYRFILVVYSKPQESLDNLKDHSCFFKIFNWFFRYKQTANSDMNTTTDSFIHFYHIAQLDYLTFKSGITENSVEKENEDYLSQIYINALRCKEKFDDFNAAIRWMLYAMPCMAFFFLFLLMY